jgi:hypothetical protein
MTKTVIIKTVSRMLFSGVKNCGLADFSIVRQQEKSRLPQILGIKQLPLIFRSSSVVTEKVFYAWID